VPGCRGILIRLIRLRNKVNRTAQRLRNHFYQSQISSSEDQSMLQGLANRHIETNIEVLANSINDFLVSFSSDMPRMTESQVFHVQEPLPTEYIISDDTEAALRLIQSPDQTIYNLGSYEIILSAIYSSSLREGVLPDRWKSATVVPLSKRHPRRLKRISDPYP
jgi:hypothetical protein